MTPAAEPLTRERIEALLTWWNSPDRGMGLDLETGNALLAAALRDADVRELDEWAEQHSGLAFKTDTSPDDCDTDEPWICGVGNTKAHRHLAGRGETPAEARRAAAEAIGGKGG